MEKSHRYSKTGAESHFICSVQFKSMFESESKSKFSDELGQEGNDVSN